MLFLSGLYHSSSLPFVEISPLGIMREGHVFTIEPMINEGSARGVIWPDGWTAATKDGKRSAQFEHTVLITEEGAEVLTGRLPESNPLTFLEERE
mmetsp:Transcript_1802/g.2773  ORF Transcript_1802/g.2773 Transcript_1802/m.2773 type:complete len:95 (+) Transcript_1802:488-772(+)